jgi:hypothetical protein
VIFFSSEPPYLKTYNQTHSANLGIINEKRQHLVDKPKFYGEVVMAVTAESRLKSSNCRGCRRIKEEEERKAIWASAATGTNDETEGK